MTPAQNTSDRNPAPDEISSALWELDPMRTGCAGEESMRDEYEFQAEEIALLMSATVPVRKAVIRVFDKWFWEGCLTSGTDTSRLDAIVEKISNCTTLPSRPGTA